MKFKWIAGLLALLLLTGCNAAAQQTTPTEEPANFDGIAISVLGVEYTENNTVVEVQWKNESSYFVTYGEAFGLDVFDGSQWVDCETVTEPVFHTVGYGLNPGETTVKFYQLDWLYGDLKPGMYRFVTGCSVTVKGNNEHITLSADFELKEKLTDATLSEGVFTEPPKLTISGVADATLGSYQWSHYLYDDTWSHVVADARHPLHMVEDLQIINLKTKRAELHFEDWPDSYDVRCWQIDSKVENCQSVLVWNNSIQLKEYNFVYEVTAVWNDDGEGYYGTATYVFYPSYPSARGYDVMPIPKTN
jgi:hypothetical protein